jgi:hypothetical protein
MSPTKKCLYFLVLKKTYLGFIVAKENRDDLI